MQGIEDLERVVHRSGRSMSRQRETILQALRGTRSHPTAAELFDLVRPQMPRITLATVYRNLHVLAELGLVHQLDTDGQASRFDADVADHSHVCCLNCGAVADVSLTAPEHLKDLAGRESGYDVSGCRLLFDGSCPNCRTNLQ
jgi:Fe2+ or Zn2+ uptake regulation protein